MTKPSCGAVGKRLVLDERLLAGIQARFDRLGRTMPAIKPDAGRSPRRRRDPAECARHRAGALGRGRGGRVVVLLPACRGRCAGSSSRRCSPGSSLGRAASAGSCSHALCVRRAFRSRRSPSESGRSSPTSTVTLAYLPSVKASTSGSRVGARAQGRRSAACRRRATPQSGGRRARLRRGGRRSRGRPAGSVTHRASPAGCRRVLHRRDDRGADHRHSRRFGHLHRGVVAYADVIKTAALKVRSRPRGLRAVSEETVRAMAEGAQRLFSATVRSPSRGSQVLAVARREARRDGVAGGAGHTATRCAAGGCFRRPRRGASPRRPGRLDLLRRLLAEA